MTNSLGQKWLGFALTIAMTYPIVSSAKDEAVVIEDVRHVKVFYEEGRFAGWPAILCTHANRRQILEPVRLDRAGTSQRLFDYAVFDALA